MKRNERDVCVCGGRKGKGAAFIIQERGRVS
jgi:hypothetical protein